jgi:transcriptional regulator
VLQTLHQNRVVELPLRFYPYDSYVYVDRGATWDCTASAMNQTSLTLIKGTLDVLILRTLSWGSLHGYAISRWIREHSGEEFRVEEGALYPALRRLEERGLIEGEWSLTESGREAKFYALTREGRSRLRAELKDWTRYVEAMSRVLEARPSGA